MDPHKLGIKIFLDPPLDLPADLLIGVFHRWIQDSTVEGLLIDVADYSHVTDGPGVMLVAHEAHYGLDLGGGRPGLLYNRKRPYPEGLGLADTLARAAAATLRACVQLEGEAEMSALGLRFDPAALELTFFDRLLAAKDPGTIERIRPPLALVLDRLWGEQDWAVRPDEDDPRQPLRFLARSNRAPASAADLLARL